MKSAEDFNSDKEYYEYLRVYFSGLFMQGRIMKGGEDEFVYSDCVSDAEHLIDELKKKKDKT